MYSYDENYGYGYENIVDECLWENENVFDREEDFEMLKELDRLQDGFKRIGV